MDRLYVIEPGSSLRKDGESLRLTRPGVADELIPASGLERLTLVGRTSVSGAVLDFLINNRVETVFMTPGGRFRARLLLDEAGHVARRQAQYASLADPAFRIIAARCIIAGKLANQIRLLRDKARRSDQQQTLRGLALQIQALAGRLPETDNADILRGIEGAASRLYFKGFGLLLSHPELTFTSRNRRPPRDPVNAMLSFIYTMFTNEVLSAIKAVGLDPYLGSLHEITPGRPSLACDLVEEWRACADRLVLTLLNRRMLGQQDFVTSQDSADTSGNQTAESAGAGGVLMKPAVRKALIDSFERFMQSPLPAPDGGTLVARWRIHAQARAFAVWLNDRKQPYQPFLIGW